MRYLQSVAIFLVVHAATTSLLAATFSIVQIAEAHPGASGALAFQEFDPPAIRGDRLVFAAKSDAGGLFQVDLGGKDRSPQLLVDCKDLRPDGLPAGAQVQARTPWLDGNDFAFAASYRDTARNVSFEAICASIDGKLQLIADRATVFPGEIAALRKGKPPGKVTFFHPGPAREVIMQNKAVYFRCYNDLHSARSRYGVYQWRDGKLTAVIDGQATYHLPVDDFKSPTGAPNVKRIFAFTQDGGNIWAAAYAKFYRSDARGRHELVFDAQEQFGKNDENTILGTVGGELILVLQGWMYIVNDGKVSPLIPAESVESLKEGRTASLAAKNRFSAHGKDLAFVEAASGGRGGAVHVVKNGKAVRIIASGEQAGAHALRDFQLGPQGFDGSRLAFLAAYGAGEERRVGLFVAQVGSGKKVAPEPNLTAKAIGKMRDWVSADGRFKVEAKLVKAGTKEVVLQRGNGSVLTVPLSKLSAKDLEYLKTR